MRKVLFLALALVASALVFTSCEKGNEPALQGKVYHYKGQSSVRNGDNYEHEVYLAMEDNGKLTIKLVGVKASADAEPVNLYLYDGGWDSDGEGGFYFGCDATPQLPNGKVPKDWETVDISGHCDETICDFDYHINGVTGAIFVGERVND